MAPCTWVINNYGDIQCYLKMSEERRKLKKGDKYQFKYRMFKYGDMIINNVYLGIPGDRSILIDENGDVWLTKYGKLEEREEKIGKIGPIM